MTKNKKHYKTQLFHDKSKASQPASQQNHKKP